MAKQVSPADSMAKKLPRRRLLRDAAIVTGATTMGIAGATAAATGVGAKPLVFYQQTRSSPVASPVPLAGTPTATRDAPPALADSELAILSAAVDRLIPASDKGPGASDAGVPIYIQNYLSGYGADSLPLYQAGLKALDAAVASGGFAQASPETQDDLLSQAEKESLTNVPEGFFAALLSHTRQGMFCDPIYGGNINFAGWDLLQYPGIKLVWTEEDQALDAVVEPLHISVAEYGGTPGE